MDCRETEWKEFLVRSEMEEGLGETAKKPESELAKLASSVAWQEWIRGEAGPDINITYISEGLFWHSTVLVSWTECLLNPQ